MALQHGRLVQKDVNLNEVKKSSLSAANALLAH